MRAHCAAASSSALRMSGRRRSISAGTLTATLRRRLRNLPWARPAARRRCPSAAPAACSGRFEPAGARSAAAGSTPGCSPGASWPGSRRAPRSRRCGNATRQSRSALLLKPGVLLGLLDEHLEGPNRDVGSRDFRGERDERRSSSRLPTRARLAASASTPRRYLPQKSSSQAASKPS